MQWQRFGNIVYASLLDVQQNFIAFSVSKMNYTTQTYTPDNNLNSSLHPLQTNEIRNTSREPGSQFRRRAIKLRSATERLRECHSCASSLPNQREVPEKKQWQENICTLFRV